MDESELRAVHVGPGLERLDGPVVLAEPDPRWPAVFAAEAARIRAALGDSALVLEHVGSTAVPGLVARPVIDVVVAVADSADEGTYVPALEAAGWVLRLREPWSEEHRVLRRSAPAADLHVFTAGSREIERLLRLRDHLRADPADRRRYETAKRRLAGRTWRFVQDYADAKAGVVEEILGRAAGVLVERLERRLLDPAVRRDPAAVGALLHPSFVEIGASGRRWDAEAIVAELAARPGDEGLPALEDPEPRVIADGVVLLVYRAGTTWRSSLWVRDDAGWRLRGHQGTPVPAGG